jgi:hypothetical protein
MRGNAVEIVHFRAKYIIEFEIVKQMVYIGKLATKEFSIECWRLPLMGQHETTSSADNRFHFDGLKPLLVKVPFEELE